MKIPVMIVDDYEEEIEVKVNYCEHDVVEDWEDFTDSYSGYMNKVMVCTLCGVTWTPKQFREQFDSDDGRYDWSE